MDTDEVEKFHLIVIGVHKAGTTSLYSYLKDHPDIYSPFLKELHHFTPLVFGNPVPEPGEYYDYYKNSESEKYLLDVSPSYLYGGKDVIGELLSLRYPVKSMVMLRNPAERFMSFYKQSIKTGNIDISMGYRDFYEQCREAFERFTETGEQRDKVFDRGLRDGCYDLYLGDWVGALQNSFKILLLDELKENPRAFFDDITDWLQISSFEDADKKKRQNVSYKPRFQSLSKAVVKFYRKNEFFFRKNRKMTKILKRAYAWINYSEYDVGEVKQLEEVIEFYKPHNLRLADMFPDKKGTILNWNQKNQIYSW